MRSYFLVQGKFVDEGGWDFVLRLARQRVLLNSNPVRIFTARAGEKSARIVAEIDSDGERKILGGRLCRLCYLRRGGIH